MTEQTNGNNYLALPQRNSINNRRLDFFDQGLIVVLDQADLWTSLNQRMVEFLDSVTLQKLVDDQLAKGVQIESKPMIKRAISSSPVVKPLRVNAPNSVFALGNVFAKS